MQSESQKRLENLELVAKLLEQDADMAKLGLEGVSQLQKMIDRVVDKMDEMSPDEIVRLIPPVKLNPEEIFRRFPPPSDN
jgi:hypothetical protein